MWTFVKIAWRNLWKNKRRTLITASAIAFSITIVIFSIAANEGQHDKMIENTMNIFSGYIQIHRLGFQDDPGVEKSFTIPPEMKKDIETEKDIAAYAPRLQTGALAASDNNSAGAFVVGVDPAKESKITIFNNRIIRGEFLSDKGRKECIIGERMARNLGIKTGSDLVLITQGIDGSTGAIRFKVKGIFRMGAPEFEQTMVLINIEDARDLLRAYDMVNSIVITTKSPDDIYKTVEMLKQKISGEEYEVLGWKELMPDLVQLIDWDNVKDNFFFGLIMMVVIFGVLSAVFSSVLERTNEFGVMLALGTKPNQIILMVMTEAFLLTLLGLAVGLSAGLALSYYYVLNPIEMPQSSASAFEHYGMENRLYFAIKPVRTGITVLVITLLSLFLSFLPAWRASRLKPDEAIRNINQ